MESNQCILCKNYLGFRSCFAYPDDNSIPIEIYTGEHDHTEPFPKDQGIRFEPLDGEELVNE